MRRAAGDVKVNRQNGINAIVNFRQIAERAAAESAGANGDDDFRLWDCRVSLAQRVSHVMAHRAGDDQAVGVARRSDDVDTEAQHVKNDIIQRLQLEVAAVAASGGDRAQLQRAAEELAHFFIERLRQLDFIVVQNQILARARGKAMIFGILNRAFGTGHHTLLAKQAATEIDGGFAVENNRLGRTGIGASTTAVRAFGRVDDRAATKALGPFDFVLRETFYRGLMDSGLKNF